MSKARENKRQNDLAALEASIRKSFGPQAVAKGGLQKALKTIPTGSLALDYELGIGGWPLGKLVGVFGPRDIGKSSMVGLNAVKNAQALGLNVAWIALEPFSEEWAIKNGVQVDEEGKPDMLLAYPETGEEAFAIALKCIRSGVIDLLVFDSIGAVLSEGEMDEDGKPRQGGQAGLITWFCKGAAPAAYRNDCCVILLNQVRDNMSSRIPGLVQQPGGHALEHMESVIVQLKRGKGQYKIKQNSVDVTIGGEIVAHIIRNKESQGTGKKATFDYFHTETDDYPFGIDQFNDVINTAKRTGVLKLGGSYYTLPSGKKFQGLPAVAAYLDENPSELADLREKVLEVMLAGSTPPHLEVVEDAG